MNRAELLRTKPIRHDEVRTLSNGDEYRFDRNLFSWVLVKKNPDQEQESQTNTSQTVEPEGDTDKEKMEPVPPVSTPLAPQQTSPEPATEIVPENDQGVKEIVNPPAPNPVTDQVVNQAISTELAPASVQTLPKSPPAPKIPVAKPGVNSVQITPQQTIQEMRLRQKAK